ncbi:MAG: DUF2723 domain-containing protein, partial [Anaerolineae bacterium]|nr:DUF2723 domain-containing protein [Anaerolineae bacterium]
LGVSHTFWLHAVRAEVYTLLLWFWCAVVLALPSRQTRRRALRMGLAGFLWGLGLANHVLLAALVPGVAVWLWWARPPRRAVVSLAAGVALGLVPLAWLAAHTPPKQVYAPLPEVARGMLRPESWLVRPRDLALALVYAAYQFPCTGLLAVPGVVALRRGRPWRAAAWFLWWAMPWLLALRHHVPDQYVFYLPSYLPLALACGLGFQWLAERVPGGLRARAALLVLCLALPVGTYRLAPEVAARLPAVPLPVRQVPGRDPWRFFLWPPKAGTWGARTYGEAALGQAAPGALILADWTLQAPLEYLQDVEGMRPDVAVVGTGDLDVPQAAFLRQACRTRPCYLADVHPYYDLAAIGEDFAWVPEGVLYRLVPRP